MVNELNYYAVVSIARFPRKTNSCVHRGCPSGELFFTYLYDLALKLKLCTKARFKLVPHDPEKYSIDIIVRVYTNRSKQYRSRTTQKNVLSMTVVMTFYRNLHFNSILNKSQNLRKKQNCLHRFLLTNYKHKL